MTPNSLTAFAGTGQRRDGRPPFVAWTLRILLCATDERTSTDDLQRMLARANAELSNEECAAIYAAAKTMLSQLRAGAADAVQKRRSIETAEQEIERKLR